MKIIMYLILALILGVLIEKVTTPKTTTPMETIQAKNIVTEFYKVRDAANLVAYGNDLSTATVSATTTTTGSGMPVSGTALVSSQNTSVTMTPAQGATTSQISVTISGLNNITGAEAAVKGSIDDNSDFTITDTDATDGTLVIVWSI